MSMHLSFHDVVSVEQAPAKPLTDTGGGMFYSTDLVIRYLPHRGSGGVEVFEIGLFSDDIEAINMGWTCRPRSFEEECADLGIEL